MGIWKVVLLEWGPTKLLNHSGSRVSEKENSCAPHLQCDPDDWEKTTWKFGIKGRNWGRAVAS